MKKIIFFACLMLSCAGYNRQRALSDAMTGLNAGRDTLVEWQKNCQEHAVDVATTEVMAKELVKGCRDKRDRVVEVFVVAYSALALAAADPSNASFYLEAVGDVAKAYNAVKELSK